MEGASAEHRQMLWQWCTGDAQPMSSQPLMHRWCPALWPTRSRPEP